MAEGQETTYPQLQDLTCPICLNIFTDPRLLPCHHSFCSSCIDDVANSNGGRTFPCPTCRQSATMPSNGVIGFQSNFYRTNDLENITTVKLYCPTHPREELDMYCTECKVPACHKCARTKHTEPTRNHVMEDLSEAAKKAKNRLQKDKGRLATAVKKLEKTVAATEQEKQDIRMKRTILEQDITNKHAVIISAANKARDDALAELTKTADMLEETLNIDLACEKQDLATVEKLQRNVEDAINRDVPCKIVEVAKDMAEGSGSVDKIQELTSHDRSTVWRPVLRSSETAESAKESIKNYFGQVDHRQDFKSESKSERLGSLHDKKERSKKEDLEELMEGLNRSKSSKVKSQPTKGESKASAEKEAPATAAAAGLAKARSVKTSAEKEAPATAAAAGLAKAGSVKSQGPTGPKDEAYESLASIAQKNEDKVKEIKAKHGINLKEEEYESLASIAARSKAKANEIKEKHGISPTDEN